jgi:hypothetical protein
VQERPSPRDAPHPLDPVGAQSLDVEDALGVLVAANRDGGRLEAIETQHGSGFAERSPVEEKLVFRHVFRGGGGVIIEKIPPSHFTPLPRSNAGRGTGPPPPHRGASPAY